uniref:(northern house mosquito) hypothetical protein n=1 Tax=Culex pipiens TaxID=7175 RepID=A0A8D8GZ83_CULPI
MCPSWRGQPAHRRTSVVWHVVGVHEAGFLPKRQQVREARVSRIAARVSEANPKSGTRTGAPPPRSRPRTATYGPVAPCASPAVQHPVAAQAARTTPSSSTSSKAGLPH